MHLVRPMPAGHGVGFFCPHGDLPAEITNGYRHEVIKRFNNYHATGDAWKWPITYPEPTNYVIDAFSPNLNKHLHVGHLRQLIIATSLQKLLNGDNKFVAMLGASLGIIPEAKDELMEWFDFTNYTPIMYYDTALVNTNIPVRQPTPEEIEEDKKKPINEQKLQMIDGKLPTIYDGPNGYVITHTYLGKPLYAFHDLCFAKEVNPTHYITDHGQKDHFVKLGLGDKFLGMGLVLGPDTENAGKWVKFKSRTGDAVYALECLQLVQTKLSDTPEPILLAWNVLAWNFLHCSRAKDVKFEVEKWTSPDSPGMYITYTWARINKALSLYGDTAVTFGPLSERIGPYYSFFKNKEMEQIDIELIAFADQYKYWKHLSITALDSAAIANFAHELARKMGTAYHQERVENGRLTFQAALQFSNLVLKKCMKYLGMTTVSIV